MSSAAPEVQARTGRWLHAARRAGTHSLAIWTPIFACWVLIIEVRAHALAVDFEHAYLPAARAVLDGRSPYPSATAAALAPGTAFVYPPLVSYLTVPFTAFSQLGADALVTALAIASVPLILLVLGVRDWRCYMIPFFWVPTYSAIQTANVTLLLALGLALIWRYRNRRAVASLLVGLLIALKIFLWPLLVWLLATRRYRAAGRGFLWGLVLVFVPWAAIGFAGVAEYPHLLSTLSRLERANGYTIAALLAPSLSWAFAQIVGTAIGLAVLVRALAVGQHDERKSFVLTIAAVVLLSPIVWMHYFVLLAVVLGLYVPRFNWVWVAPALFWISPGVAGGATWRTWFALLVAAGTFTAAVRTRSRQHLGHTVDPKAAQLSYS